VSGICARRKEPFMGCQILHTHGLAATWRREVCQDCEPPKNRTEDTALDCAQYIRSDRVGVRLQDGFAMLLEDRG
jgi:hypothetical protein